MTEREDDFPRKRDAMNLRLRTYTALNNLAGYSTPRAEGQPPRPEDEAEEEQERIDNTVVGFVNTMPRALRNPVVEWIERKAALEEGA